MGRTSAAICVLSSCHQDTMLWVERVQQSVLLFPTLVTTHQLPMCSERVTKMMI